jgi:hypothetical protein
VGTVKEFVVYTAARFGIFAAVYGVVVAAYLVIHGGPLPVLWPLLLAAVVSTVASAFLLRGLRDRFAAVVNDRAGRMSQRFEEMRAKEDLD